MKKQINLNADMGESYGAYEIGNDSAMLDIVSSANVACGYHAGDPLVMGKTVRLASQKGVGIGAHPSFPDLQGFGRRKMSVPLPELQSMVIYQVGALQAIAKSQGANIVHVKPHGTLNTMACADLEMAMAIATAVKTVSEDLILLAPAASCLYEAGIRCGLKTAGEIFADRTYDESGNLTARTKPGALLHDPKQCAEQVLSFLQEGKILTPSGIGIDADFHSICVHGDTANSVGIAQEVKDTLTSNGYNLTGLNEIVG